jgi:very-short-patch-repair endonuclease
MLEPTELVRDLRRRTTDAERHLWQHLRNRQLAGFKFRRQRPIGRHVADFVCVERHLIVELDGGQHDWQAGADERRTAALAESGYRLVRFWNNDVLSNTEGVLQRILDALTSND